MPRSFDLAAEYGGTVEQVHRAFSDEQYWLVRLGDSGVDDFHLDEMTVEPSGAVRVKTTQILRPDRLPAVVTQFHHGDLRLVREESWSPLVDGQASAVVTGAIPGAPAGLTGKALLMPAEAGSHARMDLNVTVEVRVPLVGGKIENFIGNQLVGLLIAEQRFTTDWIADNG